MPLSSRPSADHAPATTFAEPTTGTARLIVTSVEPAEAIHEGYWRNLQAYACFAKARIAIVPTGAPAMRQKVVERYGELAVTTALTAGTIFDLAEDEIPASRMVRPLDGMGHRNLARWTIVPHRAIQLETLPRMRTDGLRVQLTTGTMNVAAAGKRSCAGELGAVIVEATSRGAAHCRHLLTPADGDGSFHDLDVKVSDGQVRTGVRSEAITFGDIHRVHLDPAVGAATWGLGKQGSGRQSLVDRLRPRHMVFHDVCDFDARNAHDARNHHRRFAQMAGRTGDVRAELLQAAAFLEETRRPWARSVVVGSNHDNAMLRWLRESDFREDPANALFFLETSLELHRWLAEDRDTDGFFEQTLRALSSDSLAGVHFLRTGESLKIAGIEASIHGHLGSDGRRGDVRFFERLGIRATLGHTHRPTSRDGIYCAGVCNVDLAYARGPITSWAVGHVVTYPNGTRQHLLFENGAFHA